MREIGLLRHRLLAILGVWTFASPVLADPSQCLAIIPATGAYRITLQSGANHTFSSAKDWFCSNTFLSWAQQQSASGGVEIPIEGVPFKGTFNANDASQQTSRQQFCSDSSKTFNQQQSAFIFQKSGDPTILSAFNQCMEQQPFLEASTKSGTGNTFTIALISKSYPGPNPLIVSVSPVSNVKGLATDALKPGTQIPFEGSGRSPISGVFAFENTSQPAIVQVQTTIGDTVLQTKQCPSGHAGSWAIYKDVTQTNLVANGQYVAQFTVPQGFCHPHCQPGQGSPVSFNFQAPGGDFLRNPQLQCLGGPPCPLNPLTVSQLTPQVLQVSGLARTVSMTYHLVANRFSPQNVSTRQKIQEGQIDFDKDFSVTLGSDGVPSVSITTNQGQVDYHASALTNNSLVNWIVEKGSPQVGPSDATFTLRVVDPSCAQ